VATSVFLLLALLSSLVAAIRLIEPRTPLAVLGDSMVAMAKDQIVGAAKDAGYAASVDGIPGIRLEQRMDAIATLSNHPSGPVVIELGTNDILQGVPADKVAAYADQAAAALAADPCVVFVTAGLLFDGNDLAQGFNQHLHDLAAAHPNFHVFDWDTEFRQHPDWTTDSVHLQPPYLSTYAAGIVDTVHRSC
jgi:hypothetical protein